MRKWILIPLLFLATLSCRKEAGEQLHDTGFPEGQPVEITFSMMGNELSTKALDEGGDIDSLFVAVFGGSGYLKEYVKATSLGTNGTYTYTDSLNVSHTVPLYQFKATLTLSESRRTVHILANGPSSLDFGYATAVLPQLFSEPGAKAYWQMISLPEGIRAQKDANGYKKDSAGNYIPDDNTALAFSHIALVRNWSKISVAAETNSNFTPISMAVVNVPKRGTYVPYSAVTGGFISDYHKYTFDRLSATGYPGNLPPEKDIIDTSIPDKSAFIKDSEGKLGKGVAPATGDLYLYERPAPGGNLAPSFVIVYGTYDAPDDGMDPVNCFYKLDLMETVKNGDDYKSSYYPIFRNFRYKINISKILSVGQDSPEKAAVSAGSADVSADVNTQDLTDISDGVGRLHVSPWISHVYNTAYHESTLRVYFSNAVDGSPIMDQSSVKVVLLDPEDGGNAIISNLKLGSPSVGDDRGWRPISFDVKEPEAVVRTQVIRITGYYDTDGVIRRLYRDVSITLEPKQTMKVLCENEFLHANKGLEQTVQILIPDGLVSSMFPLDFTIEPEDMTLTPDVSKPNNNLPVVSGASISKTRSGKPVFQFIRTLSWSDYLDLPITYTTEVSDYGAYEKGWRVLNCYFKTNCANSGTTIWVQADYFDKTSAVFHNYDNKTFKGLTFVGPIPLEAEVPINVRFEMEDDGDGFYPEVMITAMGLRCETGGAISPGPSPGTYILQPTELEDHDLPNVQLQFYTETNGGDISLDLQALGFYDAHIEPYRFNRAVPEYSYGLLEGFKNGSNWSNVAYGRVESGYRHNQDRTVIQDRGVIFGYYTDPLDQNNTKIKIKMTDAEGKYIGEKGDKNGNTSGLYTVTPTTFKNGWTPSGPAGSSGKSNYFEVILKTNTATTPSYDPIVFRLEADGYITQEFRYERLRRARLHTHEVSSGNISNWFKKKDSYWLICPTTCTDDCYYVLKIEKLDASAPDPEADSKGLYLGGKTATASANGAKYKLTMQYGNVPDLTYSMTNLYKPQRFYYCKFTIPQSNLPAEVFPGDGAGTYFPYPGNKTDYQWIAFSSEDEYPGNAVEHPEQWSADRPYGSKSITFTVGANPILISGFMYKSITEVP